jgi:hypothetical protein
MKLLVAVVPPDSLERVSQALNGEETRLLCAVAAIDGQPAFNVYRGAPVHVPRPRLRLEILVWNDLAVPDAVEAIAAAGGESETCVVVASVDDFTRAAGVRRSPPSREPVNV